MVRREHLPKEVLDQTPASRAAPVELVVTIPAVISYVEAVDLMGGNITDELTGDKVLDSIVALSLTDYYLHQSRMYRLTKTGLLVALSLYSLALCTDLRSAFALVEKCEDTADTNKIQAMLIDYEKQKARPH